MSTWCEVTFVYYGNGEAQAMITASKEAEEKPGSTRKQTKSKTIYTEWFEGKEKAEEAVKDFKEAVR